MARTVGIGHFYGGVRYAGKEKRATKRDSDISERNEETAWSWSRSHRGAAIRVLGGEAIIIEFKVFDQEDGENAEGYSSVSPGTE